MLLLQGEPDPVASWAARGLLPVHVVPLGRWTAVLPAGPSQAMPPYHDTVKTLAGRPVPSRLRPAIGFFVVEANAVVSVQPQGWRATQRWFVWTPGVGVVESGPLVAGRPADLTSAAGTRQGAVRRSVQDMLVDGRGDAPALLDDLLSVLALPGFELLEGSRDPVAADGAAMIEPGEQHVARFERLISDEARHRAELEED